MFFVCAEYAAMGLPSSSSSCSDRFTAVMPRYISATCISHPEMAVTTLDHKGIVLTLVWTACALPSSRFSWSNSSRLCCRAPSLPPDFGCFTSLTAANDTTRGEILTHSLETSPKYSLLLRTRWQGHVTSNKSDHRSTFGGEQAQRLAPSFASTDGSRHDSTPADVCIQCVCSKKSGSHQLH